MDVASNVLDVNLNLIQSAEEKAGSSTKILSKLDVIGKNMFAATMKDTVRHEKKNLGFVAMQHTRRSGLTIVSSSKKGIFKAIKWPISNFIYG